MAQPLIQTTCELDALPSGAPIRELKFRLDVVLPANVDARRPLAVALLVDESGSMGGTWHIVQRAVRWFATRSGLGPQDLISLIAFNTAATVLTPLQPLTAHAAEALHSQLCARSPNGSTNICDAIEAAMQELAKAPADFPQLVVLATDGESNAGGGPYEMVSALLGLAAVPALHPGPSASASTRASTRASDFGTQLSPTATDSEDSEDSDSDSEDNTLQPAPRIFLRAPRRFDGGAAGSMAAARSLAHAQKGHAPVGVFTLGIGTRCNPELLALLADVGGGQPLFISDAFTDIEMQTGLAVPIIQATSIELMRPVVELAPAAGVSLRALYGGRTTTGDLLPPHRLACALPHLRAGSTTSLLVTVTAGSMAPGAVLAEVSLAGARAQLVAPAQTSAAPASDASVLWLELHSALLGRIEDAVVAGSGLRTRLLEISREFEAHPARARAEAAPFAAMLAQLLESTADTPAQLGPSLAALAAARSGSGQVAPTAFGLQATFTATQSW